VTIHVGEEGGATGSEEIAEVVESLHPDRIGHASSPPASPSLWQKLRDAEITLEMCPTSNLLTGALRDGAALRETFRAFVQHGVPFTIATDGPERWVPTSATSSSYWSASVLDREEGRAANERARVSAFLPEDARTSRRVRNTSFGECCCHPDGVTVVCMQALGDHSSLTDRQVQVIQLIAQGLSNEELGQALGISARTAKAHCDVLRQKLGVPRRRQIPLAYRVLTGDDPLAKSIELARAENPD
jgi:DNA-binding CsgD family transcriptional regulator